MNKKILTPLIVACFAATPFVASAAQQDESFTVTVDIGATCSISPPPDVSLYVQAGSQNTSESRGLSVLCSDQLPFTIEVDTMPNGMMDVTDTATARVYQVQFIQGGTATPWGTITHGEQMSHVGTGEYVYIPYQVTFNQDGSYGLPQIGFYEAVYTTTLSFL